MELEVANNNSVEEARQPDKVTKKVGKPNEDMKRKADRMSQVKERKLGRE